MIPGLPSVARVEEKHSQKNPDLVEQYKGALEKIENQPDIQENLNLEDDQASVNKQELKMIIEKLYVLADDDEQGTAFRERFGDKPKASRAKRRVYLRSHPKGFVLPKEDYKYVHVECQGKKPVFIQKVRPSDRKGKNFRVSKETASKLLNLPKYSTAKDDCIRASNEKKVAVVAMPVWEPKFPADLMHQAFEATFDLGKNAYERLLTQKSNIDALVTGKMTRKLRYLLMWQIRFLLCNVEIPDKLWLKLVLDKNKQAEIVQKLHVSDKIATGHSKAYIIKHIVEQYQYYRNNNSNLRISRIIRRAKSLSVQPRETFM
jgi:uncharacterized protein (DUF608 family)